jgi:hypothetical protein
MSEMIRISGLRELRAGLRSMDRALPREIRKAGNKAAEIVVRYAKPRVPLGPAVGGHAMNSIRVASTQSSVGVAEGGAKYPYMPWLDFGGTVNKHTDHPTYRRFYTDGRYIWHAFGQHKQQVLDTYQEALADAARNAGLGVS